MTNDNSVNPDAHGLDKKGDRTLVVTSCLCLLTPIFTWDPLSTSSYRWEMTTLVNRRRDNCLREKLLFTRLSWQLCVAKDPGPIWRTLMFSSFNKVRWLFGLTRVWLLQSSRLLLCSQKWHKLNFTQIQLSRYFVRFLAMDFFSFVFRIYLSIYLIFSKEIHYNHTARRNIYIYIYIYIEREREGERVRELRTMKVSWYIYWLNCTNHF